MNKLNYDLLDPNELEEICGGDDIRIRVDGCGITNGKCAEGGCGLFNGKCGKREVEPPTEIEQSTEVN